MKRTFLLVGASMALLVTSCNKVKTGDVTFWQATGSGFGVTVVQLNGLQSNITTEYSTIPACGKTGCAVFNEVKEGTYNYTASDGTTSWEGTTVITEGCKTIELY
jgi:hypothetical protein